MNERLNEQSGAENFLACQKIFNETDKEVRQEFTKESSIKHSRFLLENDLDLSNIIVIYLGALGYTSDQVEHFGKALNNAIQKVRKRKYSAKWRSHKKQKSNEDDNEENNQEIGQTDEEFDGYDVTGAEIEIA